MSQSDSVSCERSLTLLLQFIELIVRVVVVLVLFHALEVAVASALVAKLDVNLFLQSISLVHHWSSVTPARDCHPGGEV